MRWRSDGWCHPRARPHASAVGTRRSGAPARGSRRRSRPASAPQPTSGAPATGSPFTLRTSSARTRPSLTSAARASAQAGVVRPRREGDQVVAAAVEPHQRPGRRQHDQRAGAPGGAAGRVRPGQRGAVGLGRIGGGQHERLPCRSPGRHAAGSRAARSRSTAPGSANCAAPSPAHEVAPADLAALLEHLEHAVHPGEAPETPSASTASRVSTPWRSSSCSAVAWAASVGRRAGLEQRGDQRPPAGARRAGRWWCSRPGRGRPRGRRGRGAPRPAARRPSTGAQRRQRVVGDLAGPHEVPQRGEQLRRRSLPAPPPGAGSRTTRPAPAGARGSPRAAAPSGGSARSRPGGSQQRQLVAEVQPHPTVDDADARRRRPTPRRRSCTARRDRPAR